MVVEPKSCLPLPWYVIPLLVIIGLVVISLLIIVIVKLCHVYLDYREAKHLEYDVQKAEFNIDNPVYQDPISKYENPLHERELQTSAD